MSIKITLKEDVLSLNCHLRQLRLQSLMDRAALDITFLVVALMPELGKVQRYKKGVKARVPCSLILKLESGLSVK